MKNFGKILKSLRREKGLTQAQVAKETGISQSAISKWETKEKAPPINFIIILARYFGCTTDYLLGLED